MEQPKWHEYMLPVLKILSDGKVKSRYEVVDAVAEYVHLTPELKAETIGVGETRYSNRIGWALTYLKQSGLIKSPKRGLFEITQEGIEILKTNPKTITEQDLEKYPGYKEFKNRYKENKKESEESSLTPEEMVDKGEAEIKRTICADLLDKARSISPTMFENLVIDLVMAMGYGDKNDPTSGIRVGGAGDGGIDGIIKQDKLGLETIYIQAKRYKADNIVSPHQVRDFIGSVSTKGKGSKKGIFITTSDFTKEGIENANQISEPKIILINGEKLSELMYEYGIGVSTKREIILKKLDNDYFEE